jgi:hypothetical protein
VRYTIAVGILGAFVYRFVTLALTGAWFAWVPAAMIVAIVLFTFERPRAAPINEAQFEQLLQEARARAWDEGALRVIHHNRWVNLVTPTDNPYRPLTKQEPTP